MNLKSIRDESFKLWDDYFKDAKRDSQYDKEFFIFLDKLRKKEEKIAENDLQPFLHIFEDSIQWLSNIWGILARDMDDEGVNSDLLLSTWSLISSSCNFAVAIRLLAIAGLDNPARAAARALEEHLSVCIAILHKPELAAGFVNSQSHEDASLFWYENFNTKKLRKHLNAIENSAGLDMEVSRALRESRGHEMSQFSQTIHPTYMSGFMAANAIDINNTEKIGLGIFGKVSAGSERTLSHACNSIWYFSKFGYSLLFNEHNGSGPLVTLDKEDEMHQMVVVGRDVIQTLLKKFWTYSKLSEFKDD